MANIKNILRTIKHIQENAEDFNQEGADGSVVGMAFLINKQPRGGIIDATAEFLGLSKDTVSELYYTNWPQEFLDRLGENQAGPKAAEVAIDLLRTFLPNYSDMTDSDIETEIETLEGQLEALKAELNDRNRRDRINEIARVIRDYRTAPIKEALKLRG